MLFRRGRRAVPKSLMPVIQSTTSGSTLATSSHSVTMPSGVVAGDLLLIVLRPTSAVTWTAPSGWTQLYQGDSRSAVFAKVASGSEGASQTWTSGNVSTNYVGYRINNWFGAISGGLAHAGTFANSGNPDAPNLASGFAAGSNVLWIAAAGARNTAGSVTGYPSGYTLSQVVSGTSGFAVLCAKQSTTLTTDDPAAFSDSGAADGWMAVTLAVKGT